MRPTPQETLLAERLQSARGLGWDWQAGMDAQRTSVCLDETDGAAPGNPLPTIALNGGNQAGSPVPAWFRFAYFALRTLGLAR